MSAERFFHEAIESWADWGRVYQSIPSFSPLAEEIYRREGLPFSPLQSLTPGTSAVFRVGNTVVKIFFPKESGLDPSPDFHNEAAVCKRLTETGIPTPPLLAGGIIPDKYDFPYLITEYVEGQEAGDWLTAASTGQKEQFAQKLRKILCKLNQPADGVVEPIDLLKRALENPRLEKLPRSMAEALHSRAKTLDLSQRVLVHGDLTGENLLVKESGALFVIDCADACLAPAWYELAPIVFELFRCDPVLLRAFAGKQKEDFTELVLNALSIHQFGAELLQEGAKREKRPPFSSLEEVKAFLLERLK